MAAAGAAPTSAAASSQRSGLLELRRQSASFQRSLDALAAGYASQLALLEALVQREVGGADPEDRPSLGPTVGGAGPGAREESGEHEESGGRPCPGPTVDGARPGAEEESGEHEGTLVRANSKVSFVLDSKPVDDWTSDAARSEGGRGDDPGTPCSSRSRSSKAVIVELHSYWRDRPEGESLKPKLSLSKSTLGGATGATERMGSFRRDRHCVGKCCVLRPGSKQHLVLAMVSLAIISYDVITLPLIIAFRLEMTRPQMAVDLGICAFWTCDILNNFRTGYNTNDGVELRLHRIASRYMRGWSLFDVLVSCVDWLSYVLQELPGVGAARVLKSPRMVRVFFRTLRLLRLIKLVMVMGHYMEYLVFGDWMGNFFGVARMMAVMILFNHFVACLWYLVGDLTASGDHGSWINRLDLLDPPASIVHRYATSFHWSMCQYTPAPNDYHPQNLVERCFACFILLFGIAMFSSFIGKITSLLTHMSAASYQKGRKTRAMKQYLAANAVSLDVATRIGTFLKNRDSDSRMLMLSYSEVEYFKDLPSSLASELKQQAHHRCLRPHALFDCLQTSVKDVHRDFALKLCSQVISEEMLKWGDELLTAKSRATHMICVKAGTLKYGQKVAVGSFDDVLNRHCILGPDASRKWACEMALWCNWNCLGNLSAGKCCIALMVNAEKFHQCVSSHQEVFSLLQAYALEYSRLLLADLEEYDKRAKVNDLWGQANIVEEIVDGVFQISSEDNEALALARQDTGRLGWGQWNFLNWSFGV